MDRTVGAPCVKLFESGDADSPDSLNVGESMSDWDLRRRLLAVEQKTDAMSNASPTSHPLAFGPKYLVAAS